MKHVAALLLILAAAGCSQPEPPLIRVNPPGVLMTQPDRLPARIDYKHLTLVIHPPLLSKFDLEVSDDHGETWRPYSGPLEDERLAAVPWELKNCSDEFALPLNASAYVYPVITTRYKGDGKQTETLASPLDATRTDRETWYRIAGRTASSGGVVEFGPGQHLSGAALFRPSEIDWDAHPGDVAIWVAGGCTVAGVDFGVRIAVKPELFN